MGSQRPHGRLLAGEVGELAGVSGNTIGQWARWGYIRSSQSDGDPRVYSVEDVAEAGIVAELLRRGVRHAHIRRALRHLRGYGRWPLSRAQLATADGTGRVLLREDGQLLELSARGWQVTAEADAEDVRLRLQSG